MKRGIEEERKHREKVLAVFLQGIKKINDVAESEEYDCPFCKIDEIESIAVKTRDKMIDT